MCITYLIKYLPKTSDYYSSKINPVKLKNYNCFWKMHGDKESLFDYWIGEKVILIFDFEKIRNLQISRISYL